MDFIKFVTEQRMLRISVDRFLHEPSTPYPLRRATWFCDAVFGLQQTRKSWHPFSRWPAESWLAGAADGEDSGGARAPAA